MSEPGKQHTQLTQGDCCLHSATLAQSKSETDSESSRANEAERLAMRNDVPPRLAILCKRKSEPDAPANLMKQKHQQQQRERAPASAKLQLQRESVVSHKCAAATTLASRLCTALYATSSCPREQNGNLAHKSCHARLRRVECCRRSVCACSGDRHNKSHKTRGRN